MLESTHFQPIAANAVGAEQSIMTKATKYDAIEMDMPLPRILLGNSSDV
jgi:hypothetical protein